MHFKPFKKFLFIITISFIFLFAQSFNAKAAATTIKYLTACVGETYDQVGINYHCSVDGSYVIYGTSKTTEINNPTIVNSTSTAWHLDMQNEDSSSGFSERYVCKANLENLLPDTTYYYQVVAGTTKSAIQSFKTLSSGASKKTFMFLTDIQSTDTGFSKVENLIQAIYNENRDAKNSLVVMTGDQVDRGGYEKQWEDYYKYVPSLGTCLQATVPGNHEYYFSNDPNYISNEIYNQFYNNPLNGPADRLGSSYYFLYDGILFIMLDVVKKTYDVAAQQEWFRQVVQSNPAQWIIVGSHPGVYATGSYASDAKIMRGNWLKVFEECQVDLAINGHEHVYARKNLRYGGSEASTDAGAVDPNLGITYLQGGAAGTKNYGAQSQENLLSDFDFYNKNAINTGCVISVDDNRLKVNLYDANGAVLDTFTLNAKRPKTITTMTDQEILDSFNITYDEDNSAATINWSANLYGNVKSLNFKCSQINESLTINTNKITSKTWFGFFTNYNYNFTVEILKADNTTLTKEIPLILNEALLEYQINYELEGGQNDPTNPTSFTGTMLPIDLTTFLKAPTKAGYLFTGWKLDGGRKVTTTIPDETYHDITLTATWEKAPYKITYELDGGTNNSYNPTEFYDKDLPKRLFAPTKEGSKFVGWSLDGTIITSIPAGTNHDITLTAIWESPNSSNEKGRKGCKKSAIIPMIGEITLLAGAILILRKKH